MASLEDAADDRDDDGEFGGYGSSGESHPEGHPSAHQGPSGTLEDDPDALVEEVERFLRGD